MSLNYLYGAGVKGITEVTVGVVAVFDGHNGAEASEMASKLLLQYFTLHTFFLLDATFSVLSRKVIGLLPNERGQSTLNWNPDELNLGRCLLLSVPSRRPLEIVNVLKNN